MGRSGGEFIGAQRRFSDLLIAIAGSRNGATAWACGFRGIKTSLNRRRPPPYLRGQLIDGIVWTQGTHLNVTLPRKCAWTPHGGRIPSAASVPHRTRIDTMTTTIPRPDLGTTTGWALRQRRHHHQRFRALPPTLRGRRHAYLRFKRWLTKSSSSRRYRLPAFRRSTPPRRRRCGARLRRFSGHAHGVVRAPPDPVRGIPVGTIKNTPPAKAMRAEDEMVGHPCAWS